MKYPVEMDSGVMIYIPSFIKSGSGIQNLMGGGIYRHTDSMEIARVYFYFFKIKRSKLKEQSISCMTITSSAVTPTKRICNNQNLYTKINIDFK
jgi:hypothetical protein